MDLSRLAPDERRRMRLRSGVARVEQELAALRTSKGADALDALSSSWDDFVVLLALPTEPDRRDCPFCGGPIMRDATRCIHCWEKSSAETVPIQGDGPQ